MDIIKGKTWTFGENIDTDVIIPGRYLRTFNPQDLADHVLEGERPDFTKNVQKGDIIVADENFGCGSSREQAPVAIKTAGVDAIIAKSFARIFYRNAINIGLPVIVSDIEAKDGDIISIDLSKGEIITGLLQPCQPFYSCTTFSNPVEAVLHHACPSLLFS